MNELKQKNYPVRKLFLAFQTILFSPLKALLFSVPIFIICIVLFFLFGLMCNAIDALGDFVNNIFVSLPFWNEEWENSWSLYFAAIIACIVEIIFTFIFAEDAFKPKELDKVLKEKDKKRKKIPDAGYWEKSWESMTLQEQEMWLRDHYPEYYGHAPQFSDAEEKAKLEKKKTEEHQWQVERDLTAIRRELEKRK